MIGQHISPMFKVSLPLNLSFPFLKQFFSSLPIKPDLKTSTTPLNKRREVSNSVQVTLWSIVAASKSAQNHLVNVFLFHKLLKNAFFYFSLRVKFLKDILKVHFQLQAAIDFLKQLFPVVRPDFFGISEYYHIFKLHHKVATRTPKLFTKRGDSFLVKVVFF